MKKIIILVFAITNSYASQLNNIITTQPQSHLIINTTKLATISCACALISTTSLPVCVAAGATPTQACCFTAVCHATITPCCIQPYILEKIHTKQD